MADSKEERIRQIFLQGYIPEEPKLFESLSRAVSTGLHLQTLLGYQQVPDLRQFVRGVTQSVNDQFYKLKENYRLAQQALRSYRTALSQQRTAPQRTQAEVTQAREEARRALTAYLEQADFLKESVQRVLQFFLTIEQSLTSRGKLPLYCPKCQRFYTPEALLSSSLQLRLKTVSFGEISRGREAILTEYPVPSKEEIEKTLSECPVCGGALTSRPAEYLVKPEKGTYIPFQKKTKYLLDMLPRVPTRLGAKIAIFPPYLPPLASSQETEFAKRYIAQKMHELKNKLASILERYVQAKLQSPALVAGYMRSVHIDIDSENVITVEIVKPLGKKLELGKERYPLWNVLKSFRQSKKGELFAIIPLQISFEAVRQNVRGFRERYAYSRLISAIKKGTALRRVRFEYPEGKALVRTPYRKIERTKLLGQKGFHGEAQKAPLFELMPKAEDIAETLRKRFHAPAMKSMQRVYRQAILRPLVRKEGYREVAGGLVWFRTLSQAKASTSFIIPEVRPLYALEYLAEVGYQEVQRILYNLALHPTISEQSRFIAHLPHDVLRLYGSTLLDFSDAFHLDPAGLLEEGARPAQIRDIERHYHYIGGRVRHSFAHAAAPPTTEKTTIEHWYSSILGAGNL